MKMVVVAVVSDEVVPIRSEGIPDCRVSAAFVEVAVAVEVAM